MVSLPVHIAWSSHRRTFHLSDRQQRARVYEQVLPRATADDVLHFAVIAAPAAVLIVLQRRLATIVRDLPEAEGFALAGAGALVVHGLIGRPTYDLGFLWLALPGLHERAAAGNYKGRDNKECHHSVSVLRDDGRSWTGPRIEPPGPPAPGLRSR